MSGPVGITHHRDLGIAGFLFRQKDAATQWRDAENREVVRRNNIGEYTPRVSFFAESDHADVVRGYARENGILCANIEQGGIGKGPETFRVLFVLGENLDEFMRLRITRPLKEHCIHQTEDGGIRADAKREHENGSDGEARRLDQLTTRESKIMNHNFQ